MSEDWLSDSIIYMTFLGKNLGILHHLSLGQTVPPFKEYLAKLYAGCLS
jgi:hypothetical protein